MKITRKMIHESIDEMGDAFTSNELVKRIFKKYFDYDYVSYLNKADKKSLQKVISKIIDIAVKTGNISNKSVFEMKSCDDGVYINYILTKKKNNPEQDFI